MYLIMYTVAYLVYLPPMGRSRSVKKYCAQHRTVKILGIAGRLTIAVLRTVSDSTVITVSSSSK